MNCQKPEKSERIMGGTYLTDLVGIHTPDRHRLYLKTAARRLQDHFGLDLKAVRPKSYFFQALPRQSAVAALTVRDGTTG